MDLIDSGLVTENGQTAIVWDLEAPGALNGKEMVITNLYSDLVESFQATICSSGSLCFYVFLLGFQLSSISSFLQNPQRC